MSSDAFTQAARIREHSYTSHTPGRRDFNGLGEDGLLHAATPDERERHAARLRVCALAVTAGCQRGPQAPCPDPAHPAHVRDVLRAWYALGLAADPEALAVTDEWGRRSGRRRKRGQPAP